MAGKALLRPTTIEHRFTGIKRFGPVPGARTHAQALQAYENAGCNLGEAYRQVQINHPELHLQYCEEQAASWEKSQQAAAYRRRNS